MANDLKNKLLTLTAIDLSFEGKGVCKYGSDVVFVDGLFPNETAEVIVYGHKGSAYFGKIKKIIEASKDRKESSCPISEICGGCQFQKLSYEAQLEYKRSLIKSQFKRMARLDVEVDPVVMMDNPYNYRNKTQMKVGEKDGKLVLGFYQAKTHNVIEATSCLIENPLAKRIAASFVSRANELSLEAYDEETGRGLLRHLVIRTSKDFKEAMLIIVATKNAKTIELLANLVSNDIKEIKTAILNLNADDTNVVLSRRNVVLFGDGYIEDVLCGMRFKVSPNSFYQTNPIITEKLYEKAISLAEIGKDDVVLDAYAGVGTIGIIASKNAKKVISVEIEQSATSDAKENAKMNGVENVDFINGDATEFIKDNKEHFDILLMDPPRSGSTKEFIDGVMKSEPKRIVYVSCDPSTLARDTSLLKERYDVQTVIPFDMFPHTRHVESVVSLELKV